MRKLLLCSLTLTLTAVLLIACSSTRHVTAAPTVTATSNFAFIRVGNSTTTSTAHHVGGMRFHPMNLKPQYSNGADAIVMMKNDGTGETVLASQLSWVGSVQLSLDGKKGVSMEEDANGWMQIYYADLSNLQNIKPVQLTTSNEDHMAPQMSPDGSTVLYFKWLSEVEITQLYTVKVSGGAETQISTPGIEALFPTYTPDGKQIVFGAYDSSSDQETIRIMNADGTGMKTLTTVGNDWDEMPSVSPDGKSITFSRYNYDVGEDIYVMSIDGSNVTKLTTGGNSWDPLWVNEKIVYISYVSGSGDRIFSMSPDGSNQKNLTPNDTTQDYFYGWGD